ncbi:MAG TPA: CehA/McbA family metallohydrolase [Thermomicrobiales bacterium]|nr:CehA/McbA family metallohydrolase [Thermomicrobiales bacterium]
MTINPVTPADITLRGRFDPDDQCTFRHVPFDVPDETDQIHVTISYNDQISADPRYTDGNTLDIGMFDERGIAAGSHGFRGWSGSNKLALTIGTEWATPPYRSGRPGAGTWNVLLSPYKVSSRGLDYEIAIWLNPGVPAPAQPSTGPAPEVGPGLRSVPAEPHWYRGDLHAHTIYSDGSATPAELAIAVAHAGLDFFGITDHNRAQSPVGLVPSGNGWPVLVPGVEVTTYAGHFNVWGTDAWYEFRDPTAEGLQRAVDAARADGGLVSLNHPKPFGPEWLFPEVTGFDCIEPWNGWWGRLNTRSLSAWDDRLRNGERLIGICGSDIHQPEVTGDQHNPLSPVRIGWPTLWIRSVGPLTAEAVISAIRAGRCFISESPNGPQLYVQQAGDRLSARSIGARGNALVLVGNTGVIATTPLASDDLTIDWSLQELASGLGSQRDMSWYVRAQIVDDTGTVRALSNPVWLDDAAPTDRLLQ